MFLRFIPAILLSIVCLSTPSVASAQVQIFNATHTYILGDHDSKDDARQRCLLEAKRKILEQAGVYIESASEVKSFDLTKDKITSFAAAVMQVRDIKEEVSFQQGHMSLTLKLIAQVDLVELRKQLDARQVDRGVRDTVAAQQERLKRLETQLGAMQRQQLKPSSGRTLSSADLQSLRKYAAQGDSNSQFVLGLLYESGEGIPQDYATARQWYEKAAAQGDPNAQWRLGDLYFEGHGVTMNAAQAAQWFEKAAVQGNELAQFRLGLLYYVGRGVPKDYAQTAQWFEKAATQGSAEAQYHLGGLYDMGRGVVQDYAQAAKWYEKAAVQDYAKAQRGLGSLYAEGQGVSQDDAIARQWYEKAAVQGDAEAQYHLGMLLSRPRDYETARQWLEKAALQGHTEAQLQLGFRYEQGFGAPQDNVRSYIWYSLAGQGDPGSRQLTNGILERLQKIMTQAQIAQAQKLAKEWASKTP